MLCITGFYQAVLLIGLLMSTNVVLCDDDDDKTGFIGSALRQFAKVDVVPIIPNDAHINGTWSAVGAWPIVPFHMVLLKTGRILSYGTNPQASTAKGFYYDVWDPTLGLSDPNAHDTLPTQTKTNIFCSGQVTVPGRG